MSLLRLLIIFAAIISIVACSRNGTNKNTDHPEAEATHMLTDSTAGSFALGDELPDSSGTFTLRKEERPGPEGPPPETIYHVLQKGKKVVTIIPQYDIETDRYTQRIAEIMVHSDRFKTAEQIGVGSTIQGFTATYPEYNLWYTYVSDRFVLETPQYSNMQFLLSADDFTGEMDVKSEITPLSMASFRKGSAIRAVRLF